MEEDRANGFSAANTMDTAKSEKPMWLTKVPVAAAKSWNSISGAAANGGGGGDSMAKIVLSFDFLRDGDESAKQYTMEMTGNESRNTTNSYLLNEFQDFVPMCVFSETVQGKLAVEAFVEKKYDMKPHHRNLEEYHKMCRERTKKSMIKTRQIQVIDNDRGMHMRPMPGMIGLIASSSKDKKKPAPVKQTEVKRTRRDRGELEDIMFKLFERQPNWALKQLVQETDQPAQFLKEILNELCVYNKRGANQGTYELKPEYKKSVDDTEAEKRLKRKHSKLQE